MHQQGFINSSFDNIHSTQQALNLLRKFEKVLQRESLKNELESKHAIIFHKYGQDLDEVQKLYDKHKAAPPLVRNASPGGCRVCVHGRWIGLLLLLLVVVLLLTCVLYGVNSGEQHHLLLLLTCVLLLLTRVLLLLTCVCVVDSGGQHHLGAAAATTDRGAHEEVPGSC